MRGLLILLLAVAPGLAWAQPQFVGPGTPGARQATAQDIISRLTGTLPAVIGPPQDQVGQVAAFTDAVPLPVGGLHTVHDTVRISIGLVPSGLEFGPAIGQGNMQAIVGAVMLPASLAPGTTLGQGFAGYGFSQAPGTSAGYAEAVGVSGTGGFGAPGGAAWGMTAVASNCLATNCTANSGYGGNNGVSAKVTGLEINTQIMLTSTGAVPADVQVAALLIDGASVSRPVFGSGNSSYNAINVERNNVNRTGTCSGLNTEPQCWDVAIRTGDGASYVGIQLGASGTAASSVNSQFLVRNAYDNTGAVAVSQEYFSSSKVLTEAVPSGGQFAFAIAGTPAATITAAGLQVAGGITALGGSIVASQGVSVGAGLIILTTGDVVPGATAITSPLGPSAAGPMGYVALMSGAPTAIPTAANAGHTGMIYDVPDHKFCIYEVGGIGWRCVVLN